MSNMRLCKMCKKPAIEGFLCIDCLTKMYNTTPSTIKYISENEKLHPIDYDYKQQNNQHGPKLIAVLFCHGPGIDAYYKLHKYDTYYQWTHYCREHMGPLCLDGQQQDILRPISVPGWTKIDIDYNDKILFIRDEYAYVNLPNMYDMCNIEIPLDQIVTLKDIAICSNHTQHWDDVLLKILEEDTTSINYYDIQKYFDTEEEKNNFLDCLAFLGYISYNLPNITLRTDGKYIDRTLNISKKQFLEVIDSRKNKPGYYVYEHQIQEVLQNNLKQKLKEILDLNYDNNKTIRKQEIYDIIAHDLTYSTGSHTHITLEDIEDYCNTYKSQNMCFECKANEFYSIQDFNPAEHNNMLVFVSANQEAFEQEALISILDNNKMSIELLSLNTNKYLSYYPYTIVSIYPVEIPQQTGNN